MTSQRNNIGGVVDFTKVCFTDIMESVGPLHYEVFLVICHSGVGYPRHAGVFGRTRPASGADSAPPPLPNSRTGGRSETGEEAIESSR